MNSINFVVLGEQTIANDFGKKGTTTDLTLYDKKESDIIRTWVVPNGFPEKIQPLLQAINIAEYVIFYVASLDKYVGEQIIALDMLGKKDGIISHSYEVDENRLNSMIKGTVLDNYKKVDSPNIKQELTKFSPISNNGDTQIVIDHCFDVKGVGTVVLGKVLQGTVNQYDKLKHLPSRTEVMIKSIQMHDDDIKLANCPARVGLSLKGIKPDEVGRGDIITSDESLLVKSEIEIDFKQSPFYKGEISVNQMCLISVGLQIKAAKFSSISPVKLTLEKPIICKENDLKIITPLWKINAKEYMNDLIISNFKFILTSVSSDGLDERWLGKIISAHDILQLNKLSDKYGFNLNFEGGEAETFVVDCPLYSHPININKSKTIWDGYRGRFEIEDAGLDSNAR